MTGRRVLDYYPTPRWMVDHLLDRLYPPVPANRAGGPPAYLLPGHRVLEPCVGAGNITNALRDRIPRVDVRTNDLDPKWPADWHFDATKPQGIWLRDRYDWIITNPPFSAATEIVPKAVEVARVGVAMLLRITWLEPCEDRAQWLAKNPPKWQLVMERTSFRANGSTDSATSCWFVWSELLEPRIEVIVGRGRQAELPLPESKRKEGDL